MRRTSILIAIAVLAAPILFSQSRPFKRPLVPRPKALSNPSRPTRVTGDGVSTTSGVKYWDIQTGEGNPAVKGHVVKVLFTEWLENGKEIDGSPSADKPTTFTLGAGQVIQGWEDGLEGMKAGGKRQIHVPAELAYGTAGVFGLVPPNSNLVLDVELLEVE